MYSANADLLPRPTYPIASRNSVQPLPSAIFHDVSSMDDGSLSSRPATGRNSTRGPSPRLSASPRRRRSVRAARPRCPPGPAPVPFGARVAKRGSGDKKRPLAHQHARGPVHGEVTLDVLARRSYACSCEIAVSASILRRLAARTTRLNVLRSHGPHVEKRQRLFGAQNLPSQRCSAR